MWTPDPIGTHNWPEEAHAQFDPSNGLDLSQIPRKNSLPRKWRCEKGHQWEEATNSRAASRRWKDRHGRWACPQCVIEEFGPVYECGHPVTRLSRSLRLQRCGEVSAGACPTCEPERAQMEQQDARDARRNGPSKPVEPTPAFPVRTFRGAMLAASREWKRTWPLPDAPVEGQTRPASSDTRSTSKNEDRLRTFLESQSVPVERLMHEVPNLIEQEGKVWWITPDLTVGNVVIEVDAPAHRRGGPSHTLGFPAEDLFRDDCLRATGLTVIRVRLGGLEPVPDSYNIVRQGGMTKEVMQAVLDAIEHLAAGGELRTVTIVPPAKRPTAPSPLGAITKDRYDTEDGLVFSWNNGDDVTRYRIKARGRFLTGQAGYDHVLLEEIGLDLLPREQWRDRLMERMPEIDKHFHSIPRPMPYQPSALPFEITLPHVKTYPRNGSNPLHVISSWALTSALPEHVAMSLSRGHLNFLSASGELVHQLPAEPGLADWGYVPVSAECRGRKELYFYVEFMLPPRQIPDEPTQESSC